ncbi:MAG: 3-phosphoshikimate 1-carboxyvinyltransferase [Clostridia bacterium]|nr:3-phosphoshikimate 1-carboxyvinyltransferase [Clostridia bacterium]
MNGGSKTDIRITPSALAGEISAPASKSYAHRAFFCAAIAQDESRIRCSSVSDDVCATIGCLVSLGAKIEKSGEIYKVTPIKNPSANAVFDCRESASTLRFLLPLVSVFGTGAVIKASGRLPERPIKPLADELRSAGAVISDSFPIKVSGKADKTEYSVPGNVSSQFVSGLLIALSLCGGRLKVTRPVESKPYIAMTVEMLKKFGVSVSEENNVFTVSGRCRGTEIAVEGDWSNSLCWLAGGIKVNGLYDLSLQGDRTAYELINNLGGGIEINASDIPDAVPVIAVCAAAAEGRTVIKNASRLRLKESDRIASVSAMLRSLGADVSETEDGLVINGKPLLDGGYVDSFGDHRIVFAASLAASKCRNEVIIGNAECIGKSYPDFFEIFNKLGGKADVLLNR